MQKSKLLVALLGTLAAMPAMADSPFSANVALTTDYIFRGLTQTGGKPALQGGFDYAGPSGFYAGVWGSNISWIQDTGWASSASVELDTYLGISNSFAEDFTYDVGFLRYNYPGSYVAGQQSANTNELYGSIGYKWVTFKYSRSMGDLFGVTDTGGSQYLDLSASVPLPSDFSLGAHYGKQKFGGNGCIGCDYSDYNISIGKDLADGYSVSLMFTGTNEPTGGLLWGPAGATYDPGKSTAVLTLSKSM